MFKKYLDWETHIRRTGKKLNPKIYKIKTQHSLDLDLKLVSELFSQQLQNLPIKEVIQWIFTQKKNYFKH